MLILYTYHKGHFDCGGGTVLHSYLVGLLVILGCIVCSHYHKPWSAALHHSLVYLRALLYLPELGWACLGAVWVSDDSKGCDPATVGAVIAPSSPGAFHDTKDTDCLNRKVLSLDLKSGRESVLRRSGGREFQSWGAERLKALPPMVTRRADGTESWREEEERREREGVEMRRRVLEKLQFLRDLLGRPKRRELQYQSGGEAVNKDGSGVRSERRAETRDSSEVKVGRAGDVIDVGLERKCAVEDDTQTLYLRGRKDSGLDHPAVHGPGRGLVFDPLGSTRRGPPSAEPLGVRDMESSEGSQFMSTARSLAVKVWESRLKLLCCCLPQDDSHRAAFSSIAQLVSGFFSDTDLVPSDIAAGLALLHQEQDKKEQSRDPDVVTTHSPSSPLIYEIPFFVALDHKREAVLVAVRGTLSLKDVLTDLSAECENLPLEGVLGTCYAHKGICQAAGYIYKKLINDGILNQAFSIAPEYKLVITGHSLGAGTAALLAVMLKNSFPTLKCYAFSPPGGLVSKALADYTKDFVISVVLGKDLVPRLSLPNMEDLKRRILKIVSNCNKPKYRILLQGCWYELFGGDPDDFPTEMDNRREEELSQPLLGEESLIIRNSSSYQSLASDDSPAHTATHLPLFLPGRILHITEDGPTRRSCFARVRYRADWSNEMAFRSVLISPRMLTDHMPDVLLRALQSLTTERPYSLCPSASAHSQHNPM
ncbi:hypothetical protein WMY93_010239 [Mugilogobius chulae]|uniref:sn-1-specific diacylglycerol lipase n=1 Tax=Mugilogobius chulae TaxID=88201 RepID=A0AAW0P832_9GOBI